MKITTIMHEITAKDYAAEIKRLVTILESNGYSTQGMDFSQIVAKKLGDVFADTLRARGIKIKNHNWEQSHDQGLRIKVYCYDAN